jgi:hypothetical protein
MKNSEPDYIRQARKKVRVKKWFYRHLSTYLAFIFFLFSINMVDDPSDPWFLYPAVVFGGLLLLHYLWVFGLPFTKAGTREWEEQEVARELAKFTPQLPLASNSNQVDMDEHLELREIQPSKEAHPIYSKEDLV